MCDYINPDQTGARLTEPPEALKYRNAPSEKPSRQWSFTRHAQARSRFCLKAASKWCKIPGYGAAPHAKPLGNLADEFVLVYPCT